MSSRPAGALHTRQKQEESVVVTACDVFTAQQLRKQLVNDRQEQEVLCTPVNIISHQQLTAGVSPASCLYDHPVRRCCVAHL
jgi:hypothetical protein